MVVGHYYGMVLDDGTVIDAADEALDRIENMAANVVPKLADPAYTVSGEDVYILMLFTASLKNRTALRVNARSPGHDGDDSAAHDASGERRAVRDAPSGRRPSRLCSERRGRLLA